jgi:2-oxoglutarate ferredoxin oxidoreductase subunit beta
VAFALSRLTDAGVLHRAPIGIFRNITRPTYDDQARAQITTAAEDSTTPPKPSPDSSAAATPGPSSEQSGCSRNRAIE